MGFPWVSMGFAMISYGGLLGLILSGLGGALRLAKSWALQIGALLYKRESNAKASKRCRN